MISIDPSVNKVYPLIDENYHVLNGIYITVKHVWYTFDLVVVQSNEKTIQGF